MNLNLELEKSLTHVSSKAPYSASVAYAVLDLLFLTIGKRNWSIKLWCTLYQIYNILDNFTTNVHIMLSSTVRLGVTVF